MYQYQYYFFFSLISALAPKTAYQSGSRLFVFSDFIWKCFLHNLPACCHLAAFAPQQNSTNSLALAYLAFCILFWSTSLFSDSFLFIFFFFLVNNFKAKKFFLQANKEQRKTNISHTSLCVFFQRSDFQCCREPKQRQVCSIIRKGHPVWLVADCPGHLYACQIIV